MLFIQKYIGNPQIDYQVIDEKSSIFEIKYLPRWVWHTIGNAIRRITLWYSSSGAITALKIKWALHEYSVIEWVKESVFDFVMNFKKLKFAIPESADITTWVSQKFKWIGKYSSKDLKLSDWIEVLDDSIYLFEITDSADEVYIEYRIEKWQWYISIETLRKREEKNEEKDINMILIDNDFMVIKSIEYEVEEVLEDFVWWVKDLLRIKIETISEKISPKDVLTFAWEILSSYTKLFVFADAFVDRSMIMEYWNVDGNRWWYGTNAAEDWLKTQPIEILWLSERTRNALLKNEILFIEDLEKRKKTELISMRWVGKKAVDEIEESMQRMWKSLL